MAEITIRQQVPIMIADDVQATFISFDGLKDDKEHIALHFEGQKTEGAPLVRLHSECLTGDVFGSQRCDCQSQLHAAIRNMDEHGGYILYLRQEGRGIGLKAKLDAYHFQITQGMDTYEANRHIGHAEDIRDYEDAAGMLKALGIPSIRLFSNNPNKASQLMQYGVEVTEMVPTGRFETEDNVHYLKTKAAKGGHQF